MNDSKNTKSFLYWLCLALEWTLLLYICMVPFHVYFFPELWAVQVVDYAGEKQVYTEPRLFVESRALPQVQDADVWEAPINTTSFYLLAAGYVFVKIGRLTPNKAFRNLKRNVASIQDFLRKGLE